MLLAGVRVGRKTGVAANIQDEEERRGQARAGDDAPLPGGNRVPREGQEVDGEVPEPSIRRAQAGCTDTKNSGSEDTPGAGGNCKGDGQPTEDTWDSAT